MVKRYFERKAYNSRRDQYMGENEKKEFHFINEQIKKKPFYDVSGLRRGQRRLPGTYFGVAAGVMFAIVQPWASNQLESRMSRHRS